MKTFKHFPSIALLLLVLLCPGGGWNALRAQERLPYYVERGDTVFFDSLVPSVSTGKKTRKEIRQYRKLVGNFAKVYPYSTVARQLVQNADKAFEEGNMTRRQKEVYVNGLQRRIISSYEQEARQLTMSQGQLLMKLIDRETGKSPHDLIRDYKSGVAAGFWQGLASLFGVDMKKHYDPLGKDRDVEYLVSCWEDGTFPELYYSLFNEYPVIPEIPEKMKKYL
ncbi:MAG: DUF4294 domain-containing protein [Candidatus Cryptobacteroides sp.]